MIGDRAVGKTRFVTYKCQHPNNLIQQHGDYPVNPCIQLLLCLLRACSLVLRFTTDAFAESVQPTIGAAFSSKDVVAEAGSDPIKLHIWDTAGRVVLWSSHQPN